MHENSNEEETVKMGTEAVFLYAYGRDLQRLGVESELAENCLKKAVRLAVQVRQQGIPLELPGIDGARSVLRPLVARRMREKLAAASQIPESESNQDYFWANAADGLYHPSVEDLRRTKKSLEA